MMMLILLYAEMERSLPPRPSVRRHDAICWSGRPRSLVNDQGRYTDRAAGWENDVGPLRAGRNDRTPLRLDVLSLYIAAFPLNDSAIE